MKEGLILFLKVMAVPVIAITAVLILIFIN